MIYDLIVVGNGLAAQAFLFELFSHLQLDVKKSQNFSVAQIFSEEMAPACSLRTTASVSLNGVDEGVSPLGDDLRNSFFLFDTFNKVHKPSGVEAVNQIITGTNEKMLAKLTRRYKILKSIESPLLKKTMTGVELDSFIISPGLYAEWFNQQNAKHPHILREIKKDFLKSMVVDSLGLIQCELLKEAPLTAKKIVFCTGAYSQIFSDFHQDIHDFTGSEVVAGSYFEKKINLSRPSFYVSLDGHNCIYRQIDQTLIIGSASQKGAILTPDFAELARIHESFSEVLSFSIGNPSEFQALTGLRHKGRRRLPIAKAMNAEKTIYTINGLYKNGFSASHLCAKKCVSEIFNQ